MGTPNIQTIRSYLVGLGFSVDDSQLRKFKNALRDMAKEVEKYTISPLSGIGGMFVKAGAAFAGMTAAITAATLGMMSHVADADLQTQLWARSMFLSTATARGMKMALDELGVSIEQVMVLPELRERVGALMGVESRMMTNMGGEQEFQKNMRRIRDVEFEFTKFYFESKLMIMGLAGQLSKALFGDEDGLLKKLSQLNKWFEEHSPEITLVLRDYLVPVLKDVFAIFKDIWAIVKELPIKQLADSFVYLVHVLRELADLIDEHPLLAQMIALGLSGAAIGGAAGAVLPVPGGAAMGAGMGALGGVAVALLNKATGNDVNPLKGMVAGKTREAYVDAIRREAKAAGVPESLALAIARTESNIQQYNPNAPDKVYTSSAGAMGIMQLMPGTAKMMHVDPTDPYQNIHGGVFYLRDLINRYGVDEALKHYSNNYSPTDINSYINAVRKFQEPQYQPQAYHPTTAPNINVGGVTVHVTNPNASAEDISRAVLKAVNDRRNWEIQRLMLQNDSQYA
jgi:Transglycosylase SLT domain